MERRDNTEHRASSARPRRLTLWLVGFAAWTVLALLSVTQSAIGMTYRGGGVRWGQLLAFGLFDWYTCALFIPFFVWLVRRAPLERGTWAIRIPLYILATLGASVAKYMLTFT